MQTTYPQARKSEIQFLKDEINYPLHELLQLQKLFVEMQSLKAELDTKKKENDSKLNPKIHELRAETVRSVQTVLENTFGGQFEYRSDNESILNVGLIDIITSFDVENNKDFTVSCAQKLYSYNTEFSVSMIVESKKTHMSDVAINVALFKKLTFENCVKTLDKRIIHLREAINAEEYVEPKILKYAVRNEASLGSSNSVESVQKLVSLILEESFK